MTRVYDEKGTIIPVTVVQAEPVHRDPQVKTEDGADGYNAIQLGFEDMKERRQSKPLVGHCKKAGLTTPKQVLPRSAFEGQAGRCGGFDGGRSEPVRHDQVRRRERDEQGEGFPERHEAAAGTSAVSRARTVRNVSIVRRAASVAARVPVVTVARIKKGKKMAGHMGDESVTTRNHLLVSVDKEKNLLLIKGPLPGANGGLLFIRQSKTIINNTK